ncbi:methyltransferase domain-containing protein [Spiroplasma mirum]|nr:methyltransferase domain-containing protein [Spiroplasma atrichopogonis]
MICNAAVANMVLKNIKGNGGGYMAIVAGWRCGVILGAMISTALHGVAHLNPTITLSFIIQKTWFNLHGWFLVPALLLAQILGAIIGQIFVDIIYWKHLYQTINTESNNLVLSIEDIEFPQESFDVVLSLLTFHYYLNSFSDICAKVNNYLTKNGEFIFLLNTHSLRRRVQKIDFIITKGKFCTGQWTIILVKVFVKRIF